MIAVRRHVCCAIVFAAGVLALGGCESANLPFNSPFSEPPAPALPASLHAEDIVGSWGFASYHEEKDRPRVIAAARRGCSPSPYVISRSDSGGVAMLGLSDERVQDMRIKGSAQGKTYIGPTPTPAGAGDREGVSFDGKVLILKWVDPAAADGQGTMVLVRCGAEKRTRTTNRAPIPPPQ
jgi:hypothetical protein